MREIKFRAWNKRKKKMTKVFGFGKEYMVGGKGIDLNDLIKSEQVTMEVMQYTGLKDKNGKEIYEGDILKHQYKGKGEVVYEAPSFRVIGDDMDIWLGHCDIKKRKVIGNIYENPEILRKEK